MGLFRRKRSDEDEEELSILWGARARRGGRVCDVRNRPRAAGRGGTRREHGGLSGCAPQQMRMPLGQ
jgi:hypothetical protein